IGRERWRTASAGRHERHAATRAIRNATTTEQTGAARMRVQRVQRAPAAKAERHTEHGPARSHGRRPLLARGVWLALVVLTLAVFSASLPVYWAQLRTICVDPGAGGAGCAYVQLSSPQAKAL